MAKARILVQGIVQGVGFRPTVYRLAKELQLNGYVRNLGNVVEIGLEGGKKQIKNFVDDLQEKKPPISKISSLEIEWLNNDHYEYSDFIILKSSSNFSGSSVIPPDVAICKACLSEINNPKNSRYSYPFTACTDCGPRFTVIESVPYDRERTSMEDFPLCSNCQVEYTDVENRRYHAEATCCEECGPELFLYHQKKLVCSNPIKEAARLLDEGNILAMKGIGGTHLVCKVTEEKPVLNLRKRLKRFNQPFACMSPDIDTVRGFASITPEEESVLTSRQRPIVVLKKNENYFFNPSVAPDLHNIGIMLPYSGLHHLLFKYTNEPAYIMTSANMPGEPMLIHNEEILKNLKGIADYFLLHNRRIVNRCDDSVVRFRGSDLAFIRRSRGYVPEPYDLSHISKDLNVLALGPEIDVTFSILKSGNCYPSQHIGDTSKFATFQYLQEAVKYLMNITQTDTIDVVACDLHPQFFTTQMAKKISKNYSCPVFPVQHHHAHAAALAIDNEEMEMVCIAADGVGYGEDGAAWGGEILYINMENGDYERTGSLLPQKMAGGDLCSKYPARMLISMLQDHYDPNKFIQLMENYQDYFPHGKKEIKMTMHQLERNFNVNMTTSTGRVLDAISAALNICGERSYEGECAMKLESVAYKASGKLQIPFEIKKYKNRQVLDTSLILKGVLDLKEKGEKISEIAYAAQKSVSEGLATMAIKSAEERNVEVIGGSGGVFYNEAISLAIKDFVENNGFKFIQHKNSCAGDGSVSLGQASLAAIKYK
ncbi:carbamoyltransferase HypF [Methanobacterium alcaliphilum]|uniref:carbamoyltransferase HypF n=1 Tax=Methanobacterium alcaliphilum TaxID=392018 RepID=UPI002009FA92|nr:carbamoyltransferase HypF [Methanobacterium alcaliphilum]MCK9152556.1 carbamoyltransferase HypF [Methanobacterium alcaliphilum]